MFRFHPVWVVLVVHEPLFFPFLYTRYVANGHLNKKKNSVVFQLTLSILSDKSDHVAEPTSNALNYSNKALSKSVLFQLLG